MQAPATTAPSASSAARSAADMEPLPPRPPLPPKTTFGGGSRGPRKWDSRPHLPPFPNAAPWGGREGAEGGQRGEGPGGGHAGV